MSSDDEVYSGDDGEVSDTNSDNSYDDDDDDDDPIDDGTDDEIISGDEDNWEVNIEQSDMKQKALDPNKIMEEQTQQIDKISGVLDVPSFIAGALLRHFRWNVDRLIEDVMTDRQAVFKKAKINEKDFQDQNTEYKPDGDSCLICFEDIDPKTSFSLRCRHPICLDCWKDYLTTKIKDGNVNNIICPIHQCYELVHEKLIKKIVSTEMFSKYQWFLAKSFVEDNPSIKWCPAPGCGKAVNSSMITRGSNVQCSCGYRFCFKCSGEAHSPSTCEQYATWNKKCQDDSETYNWLLANTKPCPKCHTQIEKNGGCNHMTCRKCHYEFCWVCLEDWKLHGTSYFKCNRYDPSKHDNKKAEETKLALDRYIHYYHRYQNHKQSLGFEKELREKTRKKMKEMQESKDVSFIDVSFMEEAVDQLCICRSTLMYTYVFAYYLPDKSAGKNLFEFVQEDLENTTEQLSEILELPIEKIDKMQAVNKTRIAKKMLEGLFDTVESGLPD
ncbi:e3 ubiquitin-protein ligase ari5-related [Anaeramoeba ignava]|uniref:RBR-type E3 ubiquitin transferase n=1 Tax=Anaeramoeba ignava TaxID=1746090 RepID=A0A9Q0LHV4_ANAIG|nr:e3 ubiquitin-protein ligase ari5-related [Anaeramoeba ignava]|eukprot:Anaeramoba_ignava/a347238_227.p1 GENE.a347238_227~~a347238_227.p1  ORF type:complete len:498 (+),score=154.07 a347238_227:34-1527(+)